MSQTGVLSLDGVCERVCAEFLEMPGLRLTLAQAQRRWNLDQRTCLEILDRLMSAGVLQRTLDGRYGANRG